MGDSGVLGMCLWAPCPDSFLLHEPMLIQCDNATSGFDNVYPDYGKADAAKDVPKKFKNLNNIVTPVSILRYNADSQLLAIASSSKKDQMRYISAPSFLLVFPIKLTQRSDNHAR